jgi:uncharacterized protein (DUF433 family)
MKTLDQPIENQHIEISPDVAGGKPHIARRRITVQDIVIWHERMGYSAVEVLSIPEADVFVN